MSLNCPDKIKVAPPTPSGELGGLLLFSVVVLILLECLYDAIHRPYAGKRSCKYPDGDSESKLDGVVEYPEYGRCNNDPIGTFESSD